MLNNDSRHKRYKLEKEGQQQEQKLEQNQQSEQKMKQRGQKKRRQHSNRIEHEHIKVAFVGNPNCGKTTLFNMYTGAKHKVCNWPGVTVEKKEGFYKHDGHHFTLIDLPGIYSISPYSMEEILTREYILNYEPDVIVNIIDAYNLERNLYLTLQLIELGKPVIIALNMMDIVDERGMFIDSERLSEELSIPVVPIVATKRSNATKLIHQILKTGHHKMEYEPISIDYGIEIEKKIKDIKTELDLGKNDPIINRWMALKLLEHDKEIIKKLPDIKLEVANYEEAIAGIKYNYINCFMPFVLSGDEDEKEHFSDKLDKVLTNTYIGIPIFLLMMVLVFGFTFTVGNYIAGFFDVGFGFVAEAVGNFLRSLSVADWLISLIVDGVIAGVGGILIFLPNIACLFFAMSLLEDSGYMARVALLMDRYMKKLGLNGKAFIPMLLGFGCSVPAIMTARTLDNERERLTTILITPFMSCSAKIPIYVLFSRVFFPGNELIITFSLYILGILIAILVALVFKKASRNKAGSSLIMELPTYKRPSFKSTMIYVYEKVKSYVIKAGTVIFVASVIIWVVLNFNFTGMVGMNESIGADIGRAVAPLFSPLGFGNWEATLALIAGISGKEIVVSSMAVIYGVSNGGFSEALRAAGFTGLSAYAFMIFSLLYTPCVATIAIIKKETNSWKWTITSVVYQIIVAWLVACLFYQVGMFFMK
ncbi:MAG: ferrous iron transport protein B [Vallitaleaceae bacterium]|jgi:ferrous iron transport protein B|nr:ferrous iron transport protein B [Vallitaleaceae bacterium]